MSRYETAIEKRNVESPIWGAIWWLSRGPYEMSTWHFFLVPSRQMSNTLRNEYPCQWIQKEWKILSFLKHLRAEACYWNTEWKHSLSPQTTLLQYPDFSVNQGVQLQAQHLHVQIRGRKQLIFTAARIQLSRKNFHRSVYWFLHLSMLLRKKCVSASETSIKYITDTKENNFSTTIKILERAFLVVSKHNYTGQRFIK